MKEFFLPFKGVFCRVQPIAFDGTLSFLELLNKLQHYVNKLNENINAVADDLEALTTFVNQQIVEIYAYIDEGLAGKQDVLTWDDTPTDGSTNPVTSDGIYEALLLKQDVLTFDTTPTDGSTNPVTSDGIYDALAGKQDNLTFDTAPTDGSTNPVTSDGIYDALTGKQDNLTFDTEPTDGSTNPVTSDGVYDALADVKSYADNTFQIKNEFAVATRSQHGTNPTTISCNILFNTLIAYNQQNRITVVKMTDDIDLAPANVHWFYFAGFEYDSRNFPITAWFIGYNGTLTCDSLNEWTYTPNA
jgi:hypothetical protein